MWRPNIVDYAINCCYHYQCDLFEIHCRILQMERGVCESTILPNELLYGRAGYLYTLLLLQREIGEQVVSKQSVINVSHY